MNPFLARALAVPALAAAALSAPAFAVDPCSTAPFTVVDYFKPASVTNYVNQGGYHASLCNGARTAHTSTTPCNFIDLKGYLYPPSSSSAAPVSGRPLVIWVEGSATNDADPTQPPTTDYNNSCEQATYFTSKGYEFLAIVRRGYPPSSGENEMVREAKSSASTATKLTDQVSYMANESFEVQSAIKYMLLQKGSDGAALINQSKIGVIGHSFGGIVVLYFGNSGNKQPIIDAGQANGLTQARVKAMLAPSSQSWDAYDAMDGVLNNTSTIIESLKLAAQHSLLPAYYLEPLNDASYRPAAVLGKAAADYNLDSDRQCRTSIYNDNSLTDDEKSRKIVDTCLVPPEVQTSLFAKMTLSDPTSSSAHFVFNKTPSVWGPSVVEYFSRHGVK